MAARAAPRLHDAASGRLLYSRGFGSIYDEWVTTDEAATASGTFHESLRFPLPEAAVVVGVRRRGAKDSWRAVWTARVDPAGMFIDTAASEPQPGEVIAIERHGNPARKVDVLFATSPPSLGQHRANPVGSTYDAFGSERYVLTFDNRAFRIQYRRRRQRLCALCRRARVRHHFAALADEYYTSPVAYRPAPTREEPWEPTARPPPQVEDRRPSTPCRRREGRLRDPREATRAELRKQQRPEVEMEALFARERRQDDQQFAAERFADSTGAFEGARYAFRREPS